VVRRKSYALTCETSDGEIPVWVRARLAADGGITVSFAPVPVAAAEIAGAAPKAASLSELRCAPDAAGGR